MFSGLEEVPLFHLQYNLHNSFKTRQLGIPLHINLNKDFFFNVFLNLFTF